MDTIKRCNRPSLSEVDINSAVWQMRKGDLAQGERVEFFESMVADLSSRFYSSAFSSATSAFECLFRYLDFNSDDEVILSPFTFKSVPYAVIRSGAKPVFVDIDINYLADFDQLVSLITPRTKAIIVTSLYGLLDNNISKLRNILDSLNFKVYLIEDNAQAIGARYIDGKSAGELYADFSIFSFYATKNITSVEGGVIVSNDFRADLFFKQYRTNGVCKNIAKKNCIGTNMRMSDVEAAIGINQLNNLALKTSLRNSQASIYNKKLDIKNPQCQFVLNETLHSFHQYTVTLPHFVDRTLFINKMAKYKIELGVYYEYLANYDLRLFSDISDVNKTPLARAISASCVSLPIGSGLDAADIETVSDIFNLVLERM